MATMKINHRRGETCQSVWRREGAPVAHGYEHRYGSKADMYARRGWKRTQTTEMRVERRRVEDTAMKDASE